MVDPKANEWWEGGARSLAVLEGAGVCFRRAYKKFLSINATFLSFSLAPKKERISAGKESGRSTGKRGFICVCVGE